jgi:steroid delta-isomerase-like uncharacterized protein
MLSRRILFMVVLGAVLVTSSGAHSEDNKTLVRRWIEEVIAKGNVAVVEQYIAPTYIGHSPGLPEAKGPEGSRQRITALHAAFPDLRLTVEDLIADGDKVAVRYTAHGTHKGEFMGVAPTGKEMIWTAITLFHLVNGKVQEAWLISDLGQQLRPAPPTGQSKP